MHLPLIFALAFIPLFAVLDRLVGSGKYGRSKPMIAAILLGGVLGFLVLGKAFAFLGVGWAAWRSLAFFNGSLAPQDGSERVACIVRCILILPLALLGYWNGGDPLALLAMLGAVAAVLIAMRFHFGYRVLEAKAAGQPLGVDIEAGIERLGGAAFGAAIAAFAWYSSTGLFLLGS